MLAIYRWENLIKKLKIEASFKIMFTIRGFYTHESLSNHTTFRPIKSGATVSLNLQDSTHNPPPPLYLPYLPGRNEAQTSDCRNKSLLGKDHCQLFLCIVVYV
jgi:hypothetical protein